MLFFFRFERFTWKGHGFLHPCVPLTFVRCFFFSNFRRIILLIIFIFRFSTIFSLSIGDRYTVWIKSWLFVSNRIIGILSLLMFLFLPFWRANSSFFLHLR